jgi:hypothetical protein
MTKDSASSGGMQYRTVFFHCVACSSMGDLFLTISTTTTIGVLSVCSISVELVVVWTVALAYCFCSHDVRMAAECHLTFFLAITDIFLSRTILEWWMLNKWQCCEHDRIIPRRELNVMKRGVYLAQTSLHKNGQRIQPLLVSETLRVGQWSFLSEISSTAFLVGEHTWDMLNATIERRLFCVNLASHIHGGTGCSLYEQKFVQSSCRSPL